MKRRFTKYPSNYVGAASETSGAAMRRKKREAEQKGTEGAELLATDGEWELWTPHTFEASVYLANKGGNKAIWDTAYEGGGSHYFDMYTEKGPLYIFINKATGEKYQSHPATKSWFFDAKDRNYGRDALEAFCCKHPAFAEFFDVKCDEDIEGCGDIKASTGVIASSCDYFIDNGAGLGTLGEKFTLGELKTEYYRLCAEDDPICAEYGSFEAWLDDTLDSGLLTCYNDYDTIDACGPVESCGDINACGDTRYAADMSNCINCSDDAVYELASNLVHDYFDSFIKDAEKNNLGFIVDDDIFVYAVDEAVNTGSFSECINFVVDAINADPDDDIDGIVDDMVDECVTTLYDMSDIIKLFKKYDKFKDMPDWYFD